MPQPHNLPPPNFTQRQLDWLERMFSEYPATAATSNEQLRFNAGQRHVIRVIREQLQPDQGH
jgi:hypothetical protein